MSEADARRDDRKPEREPLWIGRVLDLYSRVLKDLNEEKKTS